MHLVTPVILAIDIGGTKLASGLVAVNGELLTHQTRATPVTNDAEVLWNSLTDLVDSVTAEAPAYLGVGVGCGGPMRWPSGEVSPVNIPGWREFPLLDRLRARYAGDRPIDIHNDAIALAVAEHRWGAGRGIRNMLGIVVSTGVGGGLILNGQRIDGASGNAGHIGHMVVEPGGEPCACGGRGCLEQIARGPAIAAHAIKLGWLGDGTGIAVAAGARDGDPAALAAFTRAGRAVGTAIASAGALCDLELVVIGGGIAQSGSIFWDPLRSAFSEHAGMEFVQRCRIVPAELGYLSGLSGAAALVLDDVL